MALCPSFIVKVCGVTSAADALWAVRQGANALGFNFYAGSPRHVTPDQARKIAADLPPEILRVGVFVNASVDEMLAIAKTVSLQVLQLHGRDCAVPVQSTYRIWRSLPAGSAVPDSDGRIEAYLLDTPTAEFGGSGKTFNWDLATSFPYPVILAGGLNGENVADAISKVQPWGVDACSRLERSPGQKDEHEVSYFVRRAWSAAREWKLDVEFEEVKS